MFVLHPFSLLSGVSSVRKEFTSKNKFSAFRLEPFFLEKFHCPGKQKEVMKLSPAEKMVESPGVPTHL